MMPSAPGARGGLRWLRLWRVAAALVPAGTLVAGDLGRAIVETATGERLEGKVAVDKAGLRVTDGAGVAREIAPEMLQVTAGFPGARGAMHL